MGANIKTGANVLSLFDGISCGRLAFERAGISIGNYFASEINKQSIKCSASNWPSIKQLGDVRKVSAKNLPPLDFLIGGSPCQGFSYAGNMLNFEHPESILFFEYVRILKEARKINPNLIFLLENVNMRKDFRKIISDHLGVEPIFINSSRITPQNRPRYYWTNINETPIDLFGAKMANIPQPKIGAAPKFVDILENSVDDRLYLHGEYIKKYLSKASNLDVSVLPEIGAVKFGRSDEAKEIRRKNIKENGVDYSPYSKKVVVRIGTKTMNCLTASSGKDNIVFFKEDLRNRTRFIIPFTKVMQKGEWAGCGFRKLSQVEMERLQTMPDGYTKAMSYSAAMEALGNGWTADVIKHILNQI